MLLLHSARTFADEPRAIEKAGGKQAGSAEVAVEKVAVEKVAVEKVAVEKAAGLQHVFRTGQVYSGSTPQGDAGMKSLARLGVKTIVSVDGAEPAVELAARHGMRYVHIPIGYNAVHPAACASLTRVMRESPKPVYIHCHHGKHRGPAAAAIAVMADSADSRKSALQLLKLAGTSTRYAGLWRDVEAFQPLPAGAQLPELRSSTPPRPLQKSMAAMAARFKSLEHSQQASWKHTGAHQSSAPANIAVLLVEDFRELQRTTASEGREFAALVKATEQSARQLEKQLRAGNHTAASKTMAVLKKNCVKCHAEYR